MITLKKKLQSIGFNSKQLTAYNPKDKTGEKHLVLSPNNCGDKRLFLRYLGE
jgi:hypothetical protein